MRKPALHMRTQRRRSAARISADQLHGNRAGDQMPLFLLQNFLNPKFHLPSLYSQVYVTPKSDFLATRLNWPTG